MFKSEQLKQKWAPIMEAAEAPAFADSHREAVTAVLLENTERALAEERGASQYLSEAAPSNNTGNTANWDPILISLVRRAMPNLIAYDLCGVQPMSGPTGLIFAMKSKYAKNRDGSTNGAEALFNEADTNFSGVTNSATASSDPFATDTDTTPADTVDYTPGSGMSTAEAEALGDASNNQFAEMSFSIEKTTVTAKSRALKAEYTMELAQDLKAIHGLDAEAELANILSAEILAEINREVVRTINLKAVLGAQQAELATAGVFDLATDADGRWSLERYKGLLVHLQREANEIAKTTRRGKGNFILVSADVAAILSASGMLDNTSALAANAGVQSDVTGATFVGTITGGLKVYLDPYATVNYVTVGYKGTSAYDAGLFYAPYVPLTMVRAVGEQTFQPKIGFKTRYGMVANPFMDSTNEIGANRTNGYYRIFRVDNILDSAA